MTNKRSISLSCPFSSKFYCFTIHIRTCKSYGFTCNSTSTSFRSSQLSKKSLTKPSRHFPNLNTFLFFFCRIINNNIINASIFRIQLFNQIIICTLLFQHSSMLTNWTRFIIILSKTKIRSFCGSNPLMNLNLQNISKFTFFNMWIKFTNIVRNNVHTVISFLTLPKIQITIVMVIPKNSNIPTTRLPIGALLSSFLQRFCHCFSISFRHFYPPNFLIQNNF